MHAVQGVEENVFRGPGRSKPLFDLASVVLGLFVGRAIDIDQLLGDAARLPCELQIIIGVKICICIPLKVFIIKYVYIKIIFFLFYTPCTPPPAALAGVFSDYLPVDHAEILECPLGLLWLLSR